MDIVKMYAHGISQGALTAAQGGKFQHGFFSAALTAGLAPDIMKKVGSPAGRVLASSVIGGTASVLGGGKFANGAVTGAFVMLFNEIQHPEKMPKKLEDKIDQAWAQERARIEKENKEYGNPYYEPNDYIPGVDFEISSPHGNREGRDYVYETEIDGVKVRANINYSTSTKNKTVGLLKYDPNITPSKTGSYGITPASYTVRFLSKVGGWNIVNMSFSTVDDYQRYLNSKLYR